MAERSGEVTMKGNPITLLGDRVEANEDAPEFTAYKDLMTPVKLSDSTGKVRIILSVPSLDTGVCSIEVKKFNEAAKDLGDDVAVQVVSVDTPFAQARWCGAENASNIQPLSDFKDRDFGTKYGDALCSRSRVRQEAARRARRRSRKPFGMSRSAF